MIREIDNSIKGDKTSSLTLKRTPGKSADRENAEVALGGVCNSAFLITKFSNFGDLSLTDCFLHLEERAEALKNGNLKDAETMLMSQASALDAIFTYLALQARSNSGQYLDAMDKYLKLALKAQAQCRSTLETLALIKNPQPIQNIRQQNLASQQIVNNAPTAQAPHAHGEKLNQSNELLTDQRGQHETLDIGGTAAAARPDKELEAVGVINGTEDKRWEG